MHVKEINLINYRNYKQLHLEFDSTIHLFIGDNAQGKTNLLEALYVLALAKSHRTSKEKELITWDQEYALLHGVIDKKHGTSPLELQITNKGKKAKVNRLEQKKLSNYVGFLNVVLFAPEDLDLVKGSPQVRRRFMDMEIGQVYSTYLHDLTRYHKLLLQRNALLKDWTKRKENRGMVDVFTVQMIEVAAKVLNKRAVFMERLSNWAIPIHKQISKEKEHLEIEYLYSTPLQKEMTIPQIEEALTQKYDQIRDQEEARGTTLVGPHRDDVVFKINGRNVSRFGSQGQQRTTALALKLAEIEFIYQEIGEYPILLLDDVFSELDHERRSFLLASIQQKVQTFVTNTSTEGIDPAILNQSHIYKVHQGQIIMEEG